MAQTSEYLAEVTCSDYGRVTIDTVRYGYVWPDKGVLKFYKNSQAASQIVAIFPAQSCKFKILEQLEIK